MEAEEGQPLSMLTNLRSCCLPHRRPRCVLLLHLQSEKDKDESHPPGKMALYASEAPCGPELLRFLKTEMDVSRTSLQSSPLATRCGSGAAPGRANLAVRLSSERARALAASKAEATGMAASPRAVALWR